LQLIQSSKNYVLTFKWNIIKSRTQFKKNQSNWLSIEKLCTKQVTKIKATNNLVYGNLTKKTALTIHFETKINYVKTKHHVCRTYCKNFNSIWRLTKRKFKIFWNDSRLGSPTRLASMHNAKTWIVQFDNVKWT